MFPAIAVASVVAFVGGVIFSKTFLSEVASIKAHVSSEISLLRADLKKTAVNAAQKI